MIQRMLGPANPNLEYESRVVDQSIGRPGRSEQR